MTQIPVRSVAGMGNRRGPRVGEPARALLRQAQIRPEAIVQPAADIVAGWPAAANDLMMAAAATKVPGPAAGARLLLVDVAPAQPVGLLTAVDAGGERAHRGLGVADEAVT